MNKKGQKNVLSNYFSVPTDYTESDPPYVVRPVRHFGGREFHIAENRDEVLQIGNRLGQFYASELFTRDKEYRHIFVGGKHIVTLFKKVNEDTPQNQPWNHSFNSTFMTVTREVNDKLKQTSFYDSVGNFLEDYPLDIVAFDTAWRKRGNQYVVFECNIAPNITIGRTIEVVVERLKEIRNVDG